MLDRPALPPPQDQQAACPGLSTGSPGGNGYLRGVRWPHTPGSPVTGGSARWGFSEGTAVPKGPSPASELSPQKRRNKSLGRGESGPLSPVTRKSLTSQAGLCTHRWPPCLGPWSRRLPVNHQPAPGPGSTQADHAMPQGQGCPCTWPPPPVPAPSLSYVLQEASGRLVAPSCPWPPPARGRGRPPANLVSWLRHRPGAGKAGFFSQPGSSTSTRTGSFVKEKTKSPESEVLWNGASFRSQVQFPVERLQENC